mmetsp:Transcript_26128/g.80710  ORF Transcript_26128/g.80710 Transcript_26128/m.80710 type:complete len:247 (-) Transcript_26128:188-928(-)
MRPLTRSSRFAFCACEVSSSAVLCASAASSPLARSSAARSSFAVSSARAASLLVASFAAASAAACWASNAAMAAACSFFRSASSASCAASCSASMPLYRSLYCVTRSAISCSFFCSSAESSPWPLVAASSASFSFAANAWRIVLSSAVMAEMRSSAARLVACSLFAASCLNASNSRRAAWRACSCCAVIVWTTFCSFASSFLALISSRSAVIFVRASAMTCATSFSYSPARARTVVSLSSQRQLSW